MSSSEAKVSTLEAFSSVALPQPTTHDTFEHSEITMADNTVSSHGVRSISDVSLGSGPTDFTADLVDYMNGNRQRVSVHQYGSEEGRISPERTALQAQVFALQRQVKAVTSTNEQLNVQLKALLTEKEALQGCYNDLDIAFDNLTGDYSELRRENRKLEAIEDRLHSTIGNQNVTIRKLRAENERLTDDNDRLSLDSSELLEDKFALMNEQTELADEAHKVARMNFENSEALDEVRQQLSQQHERVESLESEKAALADEVLEHRQAIMACAERIVGEDNMKAKRERTIKKQQRDITRLTEEVAAWEAHSKEVTDFRQPLKKYNLEMQEYSLQLLSENEMVTEQLHNAITVLEKIANTGNHLAQRLLHEWGSKEVGAVAGGIGFRYKNVQSQTQAEA